MSNPIGHEMLHSSDSGATYHNQQHTQECPERHLLLLADPEMKEYPAIFLRGLLRQACTVICRLFENKLEELGGSDEIKQFSAGMERAKSLISSYSLADYYNTMFLFQQWFHSSYRARQGKVLEHLMRYALVKCSNIHSIVLPKDRQIRDFFEKSGSFKKVTVEEIIEMLYPSRKKTLSSDVDVFAIVSVDESQSQRAIAIQIRSRDDTGGTTAKGSLAEFLKKLTDLGSPQYETLYLICIWDARDTSYRRTTVGKILDALGIIEKQPDSVAQANEEVEEPKDIIERGERFKIEERLYLQLRYGIDEIQQAIESWVAPDVSSSTHSISNLVRDFICWDDFWLAYAISTIEIHNKKLVGKNNIDRLLSLLEKQEEIRSRLTSNSWKDTDLNEVAIALIKTWDEPCHPFCTPRDVFLYIRDLLYLYVIYQQHHKNYNTTQKTLNLEDPL